MRGPDIDLKVEPLCWVVNPEGGGRSAIERTFRLAVGLRHTGRGRQGIGRDVADRFLERQQVTDIVVGKVSGSVFGVLYFLDLAQRAVNIRGHRGSEWPVSSGASPVIVVP